VIDLADVDECRLQSPQDFVEDSFGVPLIEQSPNRLPRPKLFRHVAPGRAGSQNPENAVDDRSRIARRPARGSRFGEDVFNQLPFIICQSVLPSSAELL
jgi:hypothetical protein